MIGIQRVVALKTPVLASGALFASLMLAATARADGIVVGDSYLLIDSDGFRSGDHQQFTYYNPGAVLETSIQGHGVSGTGQNYTESAKALGTFGGWDLFASSSLSPGSGIPLEIGALADGQIVITVDLPEDVAGVSARLTADGGSLSATPGSQAYGAGHALVVGAGECTLALTGGYQACSTGEVAVSPGQQVTFIWEAQLDAIPSQYGGAATVNYWGTFTPNLDYYNASGQIIGGVSFPPPPAVPEPSSIMLFGSGVIGLAGLGALKLKS